MEAECSARRVVCELGHSDCVVRRCWDQWMQDMPFTRRPVSGRPCQISRREKHHIVRNARAHPPASSAAIQAHVTFLLGANVSSRTIRRHLGERPIACAALDAHPSMPPFGVVPRTRKIELQWNGNMSSLAMNLDSISAVMTIVFVCGDPMV
ncbi:HTH_Tnp_Tc3_2 domain-containing protein [Trichonephila clavipes]|nr:HTH_Tnp_Tc3_2 domain-containing protein [Trichonephila clavipes]